MGWGQLGGGIQWGPTGLSWLQYYSVMTWRMEWRDKASDSSKLGGNCGYLRGLASIQCYLEMLVEISSTDILSSGFFNRIQDSMAPGWLHPTLLKAKIVTHCCTKLEMKGDNYLHSFNP